MNIYDRFQEPPAETAEDRFIDDAYSVSAEELGAVQCIMQALDNPYLIDALDDGMFDAVHEEVTHDHDAIEAAAREAAMAQAEFEDPGKALEFLRKRLAIRLKRNGKTVHFQPHSSGLVLNGIRNLLASHGHKPSAIDWQHIDGTHSLTIDGPDGRYRLTISKEMTA